jgi:SLT domain-containing protein
MTDNEKMLVEALRGVMVLIKHTFSAIEYPGAEMEYEAYKTALAAIKTVEDWV